MIFLVVVVAGLVLVTALALPLGIALLARDERQQKRSEEHAEELLDDLFDEPNVAVDLTARTLTYETVVLGARERGYRLLSESLEPTSKTRTLIFTSDN